MKYSKKTYAKQSGKKRKLLILAVIFIVLLVGATAAVRYVYNRELRPVSNSQTVKTVTIKQGSSANEIANMLQNQGVIRSAWAFKLYVSSKEVRGKMQAGTYELQSSQSVPEIVNILTKGKVATSLVTILPGQRLDEIHKRLVQDGFSEAAVDKALDPAQYAGNPALVDKPQGASLEGFLYPDSFQKTSSTDPKSIIEESLNLMNDRLTPDLRKAFASQGLSVYQGIILASIVEKEVSKPEDRLQVAQVFLKRLRNDTLLGSDVTAFYGAILAGQSPNSAYDSPYNTHLHKGLPPTPVSNISDNSLQAVAHPANTDWLYFVTGDDGVTHFSRTLEEHNAAVAQYCHKLCNQ